MNQSHAMEAVILTDDVYSAPVRQAVDSQFRDRHQIRVVIQ